MFVYVTNGGYRAGGQQFCFGAFLIVVQDHKGDSRSCYMKSSGRAAHVPELRALVRHVRMYQCGHWMMANITIGGFNMVLSGAYGSDGLPKSLMHHFPDNAEPGKASVLTDEEKEWLWEQLVPIPQELQDAFWNGGGHNCAGPEGPLFRAWAKKNLKKLRKRIPKRGPACPEKSKS